MLEIKNLSVSLDGKKLLTDIDLSIHSGERHLLSGHNGSGKSTLVNVIAGNPSYNIDHGNIIFNETDITHETPTKRSLLGIFLGAQNVPEIPGLTTLNFFKHSLIAHTKFNTGNDLSMGDFLKQLELARTQLGIPKDWLNRSVNVGFSGGERKKLMLLRLILTQPKFAILDEPDSGADANVQQQIADTINQMTNTTFLIISHQQNFTNMIKLTNTTKLANGKILNTKDI